MRDSLPCESDPEGRPDICVGTFRELCERRLDLNCKLERELVWGSEAEVEQLLRLHRHEEGRITQFIKREQTAQEHSFRNRLGKIRERRATEAMDWSRTVGSEKDGLALGRRRRREGGLAELLDESGEWSEEDAEEGEDAPHRRYQ